MEVLTALAIFLTAVSVLGEKCLDRILSKECATFVVKNFPGSVHPTRPEHFLRLQHICDRCHERFKNKDLYSECRKVCYTSESFKFCDMFSGKRIAEDVITQDLYNYTTPDDCNTLQINSSQLIDLICKFCGTKPNDPEIYSKCRDKCYTTQVFEKCAIDLGLKYSEMNILFRYSADRYYTQSYNRHLPEECGTFDKSSFTKLQHICQACYDVEQNMDHYHNCRYDCFDTPGLQLCKIKIEWIDYLMELKKLAQSLRG